jgi:branched-chain amino acid aminotransferase
MADFIGNFYSENSHLKETESFDPKILENGVIVYEVVRVVNETVLFLEDHFSRLQESISLSGYSYDLSLPVIHHILRSLIKKNLLLHGNLKILLQFAEDQPPVLYAFEIPHSYPDSSMYFRGVESDLFKAERRDPNIKKMNPELILRVSTFIKTENLYDALLVSEDETITEGSRTNLFFIREEVIYTAPEALVLKGITRQKVIQLCKDLRFSVEEKIIPIHELETYEAAFFSGTSPKILPISRIAHIQYNPAHQILRQLMLGYDDLIRTYLLQKNRIH